MSNSEELARKERRRQIIERLNEKEKMFFGSERSTRRAQMTEEELEAEIEKERALCPPP
jgi:enoyl reductase-like protein